MARAILYSSLVIAASTTSLPLAGCCLILGFYFILKGET